MGGIGGNNSYFLGLQKQRQIKNSINELIDENYDQMHILNAFKSYHENCILHNILIVKHTTKK
jgi:hypothetical protein